MIGRTPHTIQDVVDGRLCSGCGVCAYLAPGQLVMTDIPSVGLRPLPIDSVNGVPVAGAALRACPGRALAHARDDLVDAPEGGEWGPVLEVYECWSTDPELRFRGSSGGVVSALAAHALASGGAVGVLQTRAAQADALRNEAVLSRTREDILAAAGSRYAPASPGAGLQAIESADGPCVFVGKPCDVAGVRAAADLRPGLGERLALTIAIFCAGTPTRRATEAVVRDLGGDPALVERVDYRGEGWPGLFRARSSEGAAYSTTYAEAWGSLSRSRQWRCMICPDHSGQFSDVSVGDPWYREPEPGEPGRSLLVVRTERGRAAVRAAFRDGAIEGSRLDPAWITRSQPSLLAAQRSVWGRVLALALTGVRVPRYRGLRTFRAWTRLGWRACVSSVGGTVRRVVRRRLYRAEAR